MIKIRLTESELRDIISEGVRMIITEDRQSRSLERAKRMLRDRGYDADDYLYKITHDIGALNTQIGKKYIQGVTRMLLARQLNSASVILNLNSMLFVAALPQYEKYFSRDLNGMDAKTFIKTMRPLRDQYIADQKEIVSTMDFSHGSDYDIVPIHSFNEARRYARYNDWCVCQRSDSFDQYSNEGLNQMYFCLRKGFENEQAVPGDNAPRDSYGLSMICVVVDHKGFLIVSTPRWNHENGGSDRFMEPAELSQTIGVNFFDTFHPNENIFESLSNTKQYLDMGYSPSRVFESITPAGEGCKLVEVLEYFNYMGPHGEFPLSDVWFDKARFFYDGFAAVMSGEKWNFMDPDGIMLFRGGFDRVSDFEDGIALVVINGEKRYVNTDGEFVDPDMPEDELPELEDEMPELQEVQDDDDDDDDGYDDDGYDDDDRYDDYNDYD